MTEAEINDIATGCLLNQQDDAKWNVLCDACEEMWQGESTRPYELSRLCASASRAAVIPATVDAIARMRLSGKITKLAHEFAGIPTSQIFIAPDRQWAAEIATNVLGKQFWFNPNDRTWSIFHFACQQAGLIWRAAMLGCAANSDRGRDLSQRLRFNGENRCPNAKAWAIGMVKNWDPDMGLVRHNRPLINARWVTV